MSDSDATWQHIDAFIAAVGEKYETPAPDASQADKLAFVVGRLVAGPAPYVDVVLCGGPFDGDRKRLPADQQRLVDSAAHPLPNLPAAKIIIAVYRRRWAVADSDPVPFDYCANEVGERDPFQALRVV